MSYNSFYGAQPGKPFVISKTYSTIEAMVEDFNKSTCTVNFDEYAMIQSLDRNATTTGILTSAQSGELEAAELINGRVYRRTYDGPDYVGNFAGPTGTGLIAALTIPFGKWEYYSETGIAGQQKFLKDNYPNGYSEKGLEISQGNLVAFQQSNEYEPADMWAYTTIEGTNEKGWSYFGSFESYNIQAIVSDTEPTGELKSQLTDGAAWFVVETVNTSGTSGE